MKNFHEISGLVVRHQMRPQIGFLVLYPQLLPYAIPMGFDGSG